MPRTAKVFMTNRSQAVRLPKEYQFETDEVFIRKVGDDVILRRFAELSGGRDAHIVVIPTASELRDTGRRYAKLFEGLRARKVSVLPFETRRECEDKESLEELERATGVFLTGGNQLRLSTTRARAAAWSSSHPVWGSRTASSWTSTSASATGSAGS